MSAARQAAETSDQAITRIDREARAVFDNQAGPVFWFHQANELRRALRALERAHARGLEPEGPFVSVQYDAAVFQVTFDADLACTGIFVAGRDIGPALDAKVAAYVEARALEFERASRQRQRFEAQIEARAQMLEDSRAT